MSVHAKQFIYTCWNEFLEVLRVVISFNFSKIMYRVR